MAVSSMFARALLIFAVTVLVACSRSTNITDPAPFADTSLPDCRPEQLRPEVDLLNRLSVLANIDAPLELAGVALSPSFDPKIKSYRAEIDELHDSVSVLALPVLGDDNGTISAVEMKINDELVDFSQASALITLPLPRAASPALPAQDTEVLIELSARVKLLEQIEGCDPGALDPSKSLPVTERYRISIARKNSGWALRQTLANEALVEGSIAPTTGQPLAPNQQAQTPLTQGDEFGAALALYGTTLVVGVPGDDNGDAKYFGSQVLTDSNRAALLADLNQDNSLVDSGAVYVFEQGAQGRWRLDQVIKAPAPAAGDRFGTALAMFGNTLAISAPQEDSSASGLTLSDGSNASLSPQADGLAPNSGIVYLYERQSFDPVWRQVAYIKPQANEPGLDGFDDAFGRRLELSENTLAIAAHRDDGSVNQINSGSVSLYERQTNWRFRQRINSPLRRANEHFGYDIALSGEDLIVGAPGDAIAYRGVVLDPVTTSWFGKVESELGFGRPQSGAAYYFGKFNNSYGIKAFVKADNADAQDRFGHSVAISGFKQFVVGAPGEDGGAAGLNRDMHSNERVNSGAAYRYAFSRALKANSSTEELIRVSLQDYIKSRTPTAGQAYASRVAMNGYLLGLAAPEGAGLVELYHAPAILDNAPKASMQWLGQVLPNAQAGQNQRLGSDLALFNARMALGSPGRAFTMTDVNGAALSLQSDAGAVAVYQ